MDKTTKFISLFIFLSIFTNGLHASAINVTLSSNPRTGVLGQGGVELRCSYKITTAIITGVFIQAKINGDFNDLAKFYPPNLAANASYTNIGKYLEQRTTLTNLETGSSSAVITFNRIECEDEKEYRCNIFDTDGGSTPLKSNVTSIIVKGNPAVPDAIPQFAPTAGIEDGQNITFTCTGNVGKPEGRFRWVRIRGNQEKIFDSETTTATVMPGTCTSNGTSTFTITMTPEDKDVVVRCQVIYENVPKNYTQTQPIDVYYSVRGVQVSLPANAPPSFAEGADPIQLTCTAQGNPAPTSQDYTWYKESNMSKPLGTGTTYTIRNVVVNETDYYICVVQNSFNGKTFNDSDKAHIRIENPGIPTKSPISSDNDDGLGAGPIAGIAIGCAILVIIIIIVIIYLLKRRDNPKDSGSSIDEPPEKPRNNLSFIDKPDALGDKNGPFNNQIHYADLTFEDRPRSRKPLQLSQDSDLDHSPYAQVMMPRV